MERLMTIGRRKTSVARVYMQPGKGEIKINQREFEDYFPLDITRTVVKQPLAATETLGKYDFHIIVSGGGPTGQAEAIRLGISRALLKEDSEHHPALKGEGFLTRDPRMVERKKFGRRKARRKFQFSKR